MRTYFFFIYSFRRSRVCVWQFLCYISGYESFATFCLFCIHDIELVQKKDAYTPCNGLYVCVNRFVIYGLSYI